MTINTTLTVKGQIRAAAILVNTIVGYIGSTGINAGIIVVAVVGRALTGPDSGITVTVSVRKA